MAIGLDPGTGNLCVATSNEVKLQRNAFLTIPKETTTTQMLKRMQVPYVEIEGKLHILGKDAFNYANVFNTSELKRPMRDGLLNPTEQEALPILKELIHSMVGQGQGETAVYCIPAEPIDVEREVSYHSDVIGEILKAAGYQPRAINEAVALGMVGLEQDQLTGIAISCGAGMLNIAVLYMGMSALQFSVSKSGDWVDKQVAADCGISRAKAQKIKETGDYSIAANGTRTTREHNAIRAHYGALIRYVLANIANEFNNSDNTPTFPNAVPIVIGGGTSMVPGFLDVFQEEFTQQDFPIEVSEIRHVDEPLTAVARGCLIEASL